MSIVAEACPKEPAVLIAAAISASPSPREAEIAEASAAEDGRGFRCLEV